MSNRILTVVVMLYQMIIRQLEEYGLELKFQELSFLCPTTLSIPLFPFFLRPFHRALS